MRNLAMIGMVGLWLSGVAAAPAGAAVHVVTQSSLTFTPASLTIAAGDTVRWVWTAGIHTVTNGTGGTDPDAGSLFDAPLTSSSPQVEYVFATAGTVPYFCRPHESFGMKGTITVSAVSAVPGAEAPAAAVLLPNWPNPFNPSTQIRFDLAEPATVTLRIVDLRGRLVRVLAEATPTAAGRHGLAWNGRDDAGASAPAGVYLAVLEAGGVRSTRAVALVK